MNKKLEKLAAGFGMLSGLGARAGKWGDKAIKWDPALTSTLLGSALGMIAAGEDRRVRGAMLGGAGGLAGGLMGAGVLRGTATNERSREWVKQLLGENPQLHQHILGGITGLTTGALIQPDPVPILMRNKLKSNTNGLGEALTKAQELVMGSGNTIERV